MTGETLKVSDMNPLPLCVTCKHKGEVLTFPHPETFDRQPTRFHVCSLVKHNGYAGACEPSFSDAETAKQADAETPAFCVDGSGYFAAFIVREDFGCNRWEAASA